MIKAVWPLSSVFDIWSVVNTEYLKTDNLDSGRVWNTPDSPRLSANEKARAGGVAAESGRIHVPAPVPIHYQTEVEKGLDRDVALGVLEKVPVNMPVEWLHRMAIASKKDGSPRRAVDLQALNWASVRQTHRTASPCHTAASIPSGVMKACLDAWNGYHSVQLDESSRKMTRFITPWGVYRYRTAPQGYLASGDAYTHRYDNIVRDFGDIGKCVDDVCLWGKSNEENFFKTCQYLDLWSKNGIVFNPQKFVFCQEEVDFLGFTVTLDSLKTNCSNASIHRLIPYTIWH